MAKSCNQKVKILYLERMLWETGETKALSMQEILETLEGYGIHAERKSIYDDMEALRSFGMDIQYRRGSKGGYYLASRDEADSVQQEMLNKYSDVRTDAAEVEVMVSEEADAAGTEKLTNPELTPAGVGAHTRKLKLLFHNNVREEVERVLGKAGEYKEKGLNSFTVKIKLEEDNQLYGWLASMGTNVYIQKPLKTALAYRNYLKEIVREYKGIEK